MICKWCKKEFEPNPRQPTQRFCNYTCKVNYHGAVSKIKAKVKTLLLKHGDYHVEEEKLKKIINAKILIFGGTKCSIHRCPCDANNLSRYCGSKLCEQDILYDGHCHCNLFWVHEKGEKKQWKK